MRHLYALFLILIGWVLFAFDDLSRGVSYLGAMFGAGGSLLSDQTVYLFYTNVILLVVLAIASAGVPGKLRHWYGRFSERRPIPQALLRSVPPVPGIGDLTGKDGEMVSAAGLSGRLESIRGTVPEHYDRIKGCRFADRCPYREEACEKPQAETFAGPGHMVRCWKKEAL